MECAAGARAGHGSVPFSCGRERRELHRAWSFGLGLDDLDLVSMTEPPEKLDVQINRGE